jgi:hypothetical protein
LKFLIIILFLLSTSIQAQISVDAITTDTVDIFSSKQLPDDQYPTGISWFSLIIPGSGHQYVGSAQKALGYITLDVVALAGAIFFRQYSNRLVSNYKAYASHYAGISSSISNDFYWQVIGSFNDYYDYHQTIDLVREPERHFNEQEYFWRWQDEAYREEYITFQKVAKKFNTISSFCIGALVLNRIVSFIDLRTMLKNKRFQNTSVSFKPVSLSPTADGVVLETTF